MRVMIKNSNTGRVMVIEATQIMQYDDGVVGFMMPYSEYSARKKYSHYASKTPIDAVQYSLWCKNLMRDGYLDTTAMSQVEFYPSWASTNNK